MIRRRRLAIVLFGIALSLLLAAEGVRRYASTQLLGRLAESYGGHVEADQSRAGWTSARLYGLRFYEADEQHVLLELEELQTDLTLWDLVIGRTTPDHMVLVRPDLNLRFDESGTILTQLPPQQGIGDELPQRIDVEAGTVSIEQRGRDRTEIAGVNVQATTEGSVLYIAGVLDSERWGNWKIKGQVDAHSGEGSFAADTPRIEVSAEWLRGVPLVPQDTWKQVVASGPVGAELAVNLKPARDEPQFRAVVELQQTELAFPSADVSVEDTTGRVEIADTVAEVSGLVGRLAGGTVHVNGKADLAAEPLRFDLDIKAESLDVAKLPREWSLPEDVDGQVNGAARLQVAVTDSGVEASGEGNASISDAAIGGVPVEPIDIDLQPDDPPKAKPPVTGSGTIRFNLRLRDAPIRQLVERFGDEVNNLPDVNGAVSTDLLVEVPLATINQAATYRVTGSLSSDQLDLQGIELADLNTRVNFSDGTLNLQELIATLPDARDNAQNKEAGTIAGTVSAGLFPTGELSLQLEANRVPLQALGDFAGVEQIPPGFVSSSFVATVSLDDIRELSTWNAKGEVTNLRALVAEQFVASAVAQFRTERGSLHMTDVAASVGDISLTGSGTVQLDAPYSFQADFNLPSTPLPHVLKIAVPEQPNTVVGDLQLSGRAAGTIDPSTWNAVGAAQAANVRLNELAVDRASFQWKLNPQQLQVTQLTAATYGGTLSAEATIPLQGTAKPTASGSFEGLRLGAIAETFSETPPEVNGTAGGTFSFSGSQLEALEGNAHVEVAQAVVQNVPLEALQVDLRFSKGNVDYQAGASLLGGRMNAGGQVNLPRDEDQSFSGTGGLETVGIQLRNLGKMTGGGKPLSVDGVANLVLNYSHGAVASQAIGRGQLIVRDLRWDGQELSREIRTAVLLSGRELRLPELSARIGDGMLRARVRFDLERPDSGRFTLVLDRASAQRLLAPWPEVAEQVQGTLEARLHGNIGRNISGAGTVALSQGSIAGVDVSGVRLPLQFSYATSSGRGEVQVRESTIGVARGRITGALQASFGRELSLESNWRLVGLELRSLAGSTSRLGQIGGGRVSGRASLSARNLQSANDLTGTFNLTLAQAQALQFPVLRTLAQYITPAAPQSTTFQQGELRGRLARGVINIERFALVGPNARLLAEGSVALQGRLALDVVAQRGSQQPLAGALLRRIALPIIQVQTVPFALLTQANDLLADRVIYLRVTGTVRSPSIQLRPAAQLGQEAVRFFLNGLVGGTP